MNYTTDKARGMVRYVEPSSTVIGSAPIYTKLVRMSAAEFLGAYASPVELVPPPGAGKFIQCFGGSCIIHFNTTQSANGGALKVQYGNAIHGAGDDAFTFRLAFDATAMNAVNQDWHEGLGGFGTNDILPPDNQGIYFSNDTAAFTAFDGSFSFYLYYIVGNV